MVEKGKLIGIGVGPGDSELLTLKAVKILSKVPVICSPKSSPNKESIALSIVTPILKEREDYKRIMVVEPLFPMIEDEKSLERHWDSASEIIADYLNSGRDVAFITLGDPSIFSTFSYVQKRLKKNYEVEIVPGITSFTACSASINKPLVEKNQILTIIPKIDNRLDYILDYSDSVVIMKPSRNTDGLNEIVNSKNRKKEITSIENCTRKNEKIIEGFSKEKPYLTTTIVKFID